MFFGPSRKIKFVILLFLLSFVAWFVYEVGQEEARNPKGPSAIEAETAKKPVNLNSGDSLDQAYPIEPGAYCETHADEFLRQAAKWSFRWDDIGFFEHKFDKHLERIKSPGVLTMVSDRVSLSNGFGAFQRKLLACDYDTQSKIVREYSIHDMEP